jgi:hypothetical protein
VCGSVALQRGCKLRNGSVDLGGRPLHHALKAIEQPLWFDAHQNTDPPAHGYRSFVSATYGGHKQGDGPRRRMRFGRRMTNTRV